MVRLVETSNVALGDSIQINYQGRQTAFIEVPAIGDGNCALNSIALWFIDHLLKLKHDNAQLDLEEEAINKLIHAIQANIQILKDRQKLYQGLSSPIQGHAYPELAGPLQAFIQFIDNKPIDAYQLVHYIQTQCGSREKIAALHVALAPGLRAIGVDQYLEHLGIRDANDQDLPADDVFLREDGQSAGEEILHAIGNVFNVNVMLFDSKRKGPVIFPEKASPQTAYIYSRPGHFNYLIPANEKNGLHAALSPDVPVEETRQSRLQLKTNTLLVQQNETAIRLLPAEKKLTQPELQQIAEVAQAVSNNLIEIEHNTSLIKDAALNSSHLVANVKKKLDITENKLNGLVRNDLEKSLLLNEPAGLSSPTDPDEALAHSLQNAEILSFLSSNIRFFSKQDDRAEKREEVERGNRHGI